MALHHRLINKAARFYWRITRPRTLGVRCLLLDPEERIALVRHTYLAHWHLPGGGVKKKEGFAAALARELREEVAITEFRVDRVLGIYHSLREGKDDHIVIYVARTPRVEPTLTRADRLEIAEAGWFALDDLPGDVSPATARRVTEYRAGTTGSGEW